MSILSKLNSPVMYLIVGAVILFVALTCVLFMVRAYRAGLAIGMDKEKMKRTVAASATFAVLPSVGILLGVIALSGSLGTPLPWLRLSVIGALHYETQVAEAAAEAVGLPGLSAAAMTEQAFTTIALVMSVCIIWGMVLAVIFTKRYTSGKKKEAGNTSKTEAADSVNAEKTAASQKKSPFAGFGDKAMTAMFIGLVSCYIGSYISEFISGTRPFSFDGSLIPLLVAIVGGGAMAMFLYFRNKKKAEWLDSFSIAGSMLIAMAAAVLFGTFLK